MTEREKKLRLWLTILCMLLWTSVRFKCMLPVKLSTILEDDMFRFTVPLPRKLGANNWRIFCMLDCLIQRCLNSGCICFFEKS